MSAAEYWCVALPNKEGESATLRAVNAEIASKEDDLAEVFQFEVPTLRVGTLERLMLTSDQLVKTDQAVESVIRKIERTFAEVNVNNEVLTVDSEPVLRYMQNFRWSSAKYQTTRPIEELVKAIQQGGQKIEEELKEATSIFQEKKQTMAALQRKKGGNLMVAELSDVLTENVVKANWFVDTEYLTTVVVVVPKQNENEFLQVYETMANDAVGYGPPENRQKVVGSPVVPRSAIRVTEDKEGFVLYLVTLLKLYVEQFKSACLARRFLVRSFTYNPVSNTEQRDAATNMEIEFEQARNQLARWAKTHYGEAFSAWMHVKAIRVFVEAVLRYGLPVDFLPILIKPKKKSNEKKLRAKLLDLFAKLHGTAVTDFAESAGGAGSAMEAMGGEYHPYVSYTIVPQPGSS